MSLHEEEGDDKMLQGQSKLTMEALFDGLFHQEWTTSQDMHLWGKRLWTPMSNCTQWTVKVIKFLLNQLFELWNRRNEFVHGSTEQANQQIK